MDQKCPLCGAPRYVDHSHWTDGLSTRSANVLIANGFTRASEVATYLDAGGDLTRFAGSGTKTADEIARWLNSFSQSKASSQ